MPDESSRELDSLQYSLARYGAMAPALAFRAGSAEKIESWRTQARAKLWALIGAPPSGRVPLAAVFEERREFKGYSRTPVTFETRPGLSAFGYLLKPDPLQAPAPAVLCLPGHGRGVDEIVGIDEQGNDRDDPDGYQHDFAVQCARQGFVTLALEPIGFGHRRDAAARAKSASQSSCQPASGAALMLGETMVGWRVWDAVRGVDLLSALPEVDSQRIAMMGISGGGTVTLYTAALDTRVQAAVLSGSFATFRDSIFSLSHCIDNYVPGILSCFETADIAGLITPRYFFCESGLHDEWFPEPGARRAYAALAEIYEACGVPDHIDSHFFDAGHQFNGRRAFPRLKEWLKMEKA
jgi:dienelactone hydrolase